MKSGKCENISLGRVKTENRGDVLWLLLVRNSVRYIEKIAVAGGVKLENIELMKRYGIDTVIVGGAISKAADIREAAEAFAQEIRRQK